MIEMVINEVKRSGVSRKNIYTFLSLVYKEEVDDELLETLRMVNWKLLLPIGKGELKEGCEILQRFLEGSKNRQVIEDLAVDFASLFLGHGRNPAHPYESVYLGKEKVVMQEQRNNIVKIYAEEGFQRTEEFNEPEDHVAIELEFMARLCWKMVDMLAEGDVEGAIKTLEVQKGFIKNHMGVWVPAFCGDVLKNAELDYYKAIAKITRGFLAIDSKNINRSIRSLSKQ